MNYPNGKRKTVINTVKTSVSNRGMSLEEDINTSNAFYLASDEAIIHKKPTPITIVKVDYPTRNKAKITEAYFKLPSTTDYNGIYKGRYIDFEAKEIASATAFPFACIHAHQIKHLEGVLRHGAIAFIIIRMSHYGIDYLIKAEDFLNYYKNADRKSLPYSWIKENGYEIKYSYQKPCDYLRVIKEIYEV
ncbi:MAG: Holliday junction resolvase RecU [Erysipelotrichaceae bacterium]|nr:Holliday junction resolvase RecU [Erysipelotrichaceae bacterium]